jgi:hypothetical protein
VNRTLAVPFFGSCAVLVAILPLEWLPSAPPPVPHATAPHPVSASASTAEARDIDDLADTVLGRPLFTVGRRPPKSSGGGRMAVNTGYPRLAGIMITPFGKRAIFAPDGGKPLVLAEGGALDDATVRSIKRDRVVVTGPKGDQVLWPTYDHNRVGGGTTVPTFPQPGFNPGGGAPGFGGQFPGRPTFPVQPQMPQPPPPAPAGSAEEDDAGDAATPVTPTPPPFVQQNLPGQQVPAFPRE